MPNFRVRYQTIEFSHCDIHVRCLRSNQEFSDPFGEAEAYGISSAQWSLFGVLWPSSEVLGCEMEREDISNKRILEVGCGLGLASLLLNSRGADITATDMHPQAGVFLAENARLNEHARIPFLRTDWNSSDDGLGKFDLIIGSDVLYERGHIELLSEFINRHAAEACVIVMVDPGRNNHASFSKKMITLGFDHQQYQPERTEFTTGSFTGQVLRYTRQAVSDSA